MFIHPANAYRLEYPADWEHLEKDEGRSCGFGPRERDDVGLWITILPLSINTERIERDLPGIFASAIGEGEAANVRRDRSLRHLGFKADGTSEETANFWIITGGDLVLFASSQAPENEREIWNPQFERLMSSLEIMRERELLLRKTDDDLLQRLRRLHPEQDYHFDDARIRGRDHTISPANLYKEVAAAPERREAIVANFVEGLASLAHQPPGRESLEDVRDNILPLLRPVSYVEAGMGTEHLVRTEWLANLFICYAIRTHRVSRLLTTWDRERWRMGQEELHDLAIGNLTQLPWPERLEGARESGGRLIMLATNDGLDASRLLHPDLHRIFSGPLGSPFYAGIPNDDTLVAFSGGNSSLFEHVLQQIQRDYETSSRPITPNPFLVTAGGIASGKM
ncbi:MAG TPA: DUF1444 family protein [Terriglobia bacterium]|jgi:uncharacterized protein YtpQ (UPF0354 family)